MSGATEDTVHAEVDASDRFTLLASAIAGRPLEVTAGDPGMPAWTDGHTVFIDAEAPHQTQVLCVAVQACLLCAGSLEPRVLDKLARKPPAARRYLSLEGHRALNALWGLLPTTVLPATDHLTAHRTDSPQSSLVLALGSEEIPDPPAAFGVIRPGLVGQVRDDRTEELRRSQAPPRERQALLRELEDDVGEDPVVEFLSSPVGGGGPIGRLLKRLLGDARSSATGAPGADAPTRFARSGSRGSRLGAPTAGQMATSDDGSLGAVRGFVYPEWDVHHRRYRPQWCTVVELEPEKGERSRSPRRNTRSLRRRAGLSRDGARATRSPAARGGSRSRRRSRVLRRFPGRLAPRRRRLHGEPTESAGPLGARPPRHLRFLWSAERVRRHRPRPPAVRCHRPHGGAVRGGGSGRPLRIPLAGAIRRAHLPGEEIR